MIDYDYLRKEYITCLRDKSRVYMITHYLKTYDTTVNQTVPFQLFPRQQDLCQALGSANNVVTSKPRQAGITTTVAAFISCELALSPRESPKNILIIGNTIDLSQNMLFKIRDFLEQLPWWFFGDDFYNDDISAPADMHKLYVKRNDKYVELFNGCKIYAKSSGKDASRGVSSVHWLIVDEAAFIADGVDTFSSALAATSTGGHTVMISTPNGKDQLYYETCRRAELKGTDDWNNFELIKLKWIQDPRYNRFLEWTKKNPETGEVEVVAEPTLDKLGNIKYDEEHWEKMEADGWKPRSPWYIKMCRQFNNDSKKIAQELDVSFLGSAANVVEPEFIEMQLKTNVREPLYKDKFVDDTWVWKAPIEGHRYLMSIDASRGDASDRSAIEIIDMDGVDENGAPILEQVLEFHGKRTGDELAELAFEYGKAYGWAFAVVDCIGGSGDACVLGLRNMGYPNLYYDDPNLKRYTMEREISSVQTTDDGKVPGFHSGSVRFQMLTGFANMVKTNEFKIRSKRVIGELDTWIYKGEAQRIDHMSGCHDDTLTCLAMGVFVMKYSLNKLIEAKKRDVAFLKALSGIPINGTPSEDKQTDIKDKYPTMFYTNRSFEQSSFMGRGELIPF